ncbi:THAP domain-containing protein 1 B-like [Cydia strobilella]|uniref:THAP domain-containing protein 1 B-like n=1 Tax=Cydia strobilella TaxID=1100964 RepID=UPI00300417F5
MVYCSVKWCGKSSKTSKYKTDGITFHRFPKNPAIKSKWIDATYRGELWFPCNTSVICSRHFTADNFHQVTSQRRRLMSSAVPTLYLPVLIDDITQQHNNSAVAVKIPLNIICVCDIHDEGTSKKEDHGSTLQESVLIITSQQQNTVSETATRKRKLSQIRDPDTPSAYDTTVNKQLCRRIMELKSIVNEKNVKLRKLRDSNRRLKREIISLKFHLGEIEELE